jgi:hypothetical protein
LAGYRNGFDRRSIPDATHSIPFPTHSTWITRQFVTKGLADVTVVGHHEILRQELRDRGFGLCVSMMLSECEC